MLSTYQLLYEIRTDNMKKQYGHRFQISAFEVPGLGCFFVIFMEPEADTTIQEHCSVSGGDC